MWRAGECGGGEREGKAHLIVPARAHDRVGAAAVERVRGCDARLHHLAGKGEHRRAHPERVAGRSVTGVGRGVEEEVDVRCAGEVVAGGAWGGRVGG